MVKRLNDIALLNKSSQYCGVSLALWDHTVLPVTRHKCHCLSQPYRPSPWRLSAATHCAYHGQAGLTSMTECYSIIMVYSKLCYRMHVLFGSESDVMYWISGDGLVLSIVINYHILWNYSWNALPLVISCCGLGDTKGTWDKLLLQNLLDCRVWWVLACLIRMLRIMMTGGWESGAAG